MLDFIIDSYRKICNLTYHNLEIHHNNALNSLYSREFSARDLQLLSLIDVMGGNATPTVLKNLLYVQITALTNTLNHYQYQGLIIKQKSETDNRNVLLTLSLKGQKKIELYNKYINELVQKIRTSMTIVESITLVSTIKKLNVLIKSSATTMTENPKGSNHLSSIILFQLQNYFYYLENEFINAQKISLKQRDLFFITELYLHILSGSKNIKSLSVFIKMPYQTVVSKINKLLKDEIITKREENISFPDETLHLIEKFIYFRIIIYHETMTGFSEKEKAIIYKMFDILKEHSIQKTKKTN